MSWRLGIKTVYYVKLDNELKELSVSELHQLIEDQVIYGNSYVYETLSKQWMPLNELPVFKALGMSFPQTSEKQVPPERSPIKMKTQVGHVLTDQSSFVSDDTHLQDYVKVFQTQFDILLDKNLELVDENIKLKVSKNELITQNEVTKLDYESKYQKQSKEIDVLTNKIEDGEAHIQSLLAENKILHEKINSSHREVNLKLEHSFQEYKELEHTLKLKNDKIEELQVEIENLLSDLKKEHLDKEKLNAEVENLREKNKILEQDEKYIAGQDKIKTQYNQIIAKKNEKIHLLLQQNEKIKDKFSEESKQVKSQFEQYQFSLKAEQEKVKKLNVVVLEERKKAQELEKLLEDQKSLEKKIASDQSSPLRNDKSVGKVVEINNNAIWEVRGLESAQDKKFTFLELKDLILSKEVDNNTFVRQESKWWKKIKDCPEFKINYFTKTVAGETKVFIERQNIRIPTHFRVTLTTEKAEFTGLCINLSKGGCFIEVNEFNAYDLRAEDEVVLKSESELFIEKGFSLKALIKAVIPEERGLGLQFIELNDSQTQALEDQVSHFLDLLDEAA
ncbi:MAG: hypothetical protein CME62_05385 [Halobacteriovoraceae bacterium]|nr:hypothetical protein [Halobacteriovoraceae bacterium]|tara:strand:+ start:21709 stop:23394 length:1686 start_codon:yes stop_codon:yes gene_type:complete